MHGKAAAGSTDRGGLRAGLIELRLAELGHRGVKGEWNWAPPHDIDETTFRGIDPYILDLQAICRQ